MASSATVLAWGLIEYRDAYEASGELDYMLDCIKWATDYFLKCHTGPKEFYAQVRQNNDTKSKTKQKERKGERRINSLGFFYQFCKMYGSDEIKSQKCNS